jgi:hypothetical protein
MALGSLDFVLLIIVLIVAIFSTLLSFFNLRFTKMFFSHYMEDLSSYSTAIKDFDPAEDEIEEIQTQEYDEDEDEDKILKREEIKLEIDRDAERRSDEIKRNELLLEKLEKHYSTLRKVSKDMLESIINPPEFSKLSDNYVPIPLMDEKPLWLDLANNHIPKTKGDLSALWSLYVQIMNQYSHERTEVIKSLRRSIFGNTDYNKSDMEVDLEKSENFYYSEPLVYIANKIFFGSPEIHFKIEELKRGKRGNGIAVLKLNDQNFIQGKSSELLALQSIFEEIIEKRDTSLTEETRNLKQSLGHLKNIIMDIKELLNWFIFEEDNMTQCDMLER